MYNPEKIRVHKTKKNTTQYMLDTTIRKETHNLWENHNGDHNTPN